MGLAGDFRGGSGSGSGYRVTGLESGSESELGLEPHFSVAGGRVCTAFKRAGHVAQRELVARVSLAAQVRRVCKARLSQRRSGSVSGLQQVECTGTAISFGEGYRVGHARRPQLWGRRAIINARGSTGGSGV